MYKHYPVLFDETPEDMPSLFFSAALLFASAAVAAATNVDVSVGNTQCTVLADGVLQACNQCPTNRRSALATQQ